MLCHWPSSSWCCKDCSVLTFRVKQSTNNFNFPPLQYLIINSFYFFTFTPNFPAVSTDTASTIPSDLPPSVASHYPHHQYLQHTGCLFTLLLILACLTQKKNAVCSLEEWGAPCPLIRHNIKTHLLCTQYQNQEGHGNKELPD